MQESSWSTKRKHMKSLPGSDFSSVWCSNAIVSQRRLLWWSEDMMSHVTGGLIDLLRKRLGELTAVLPGLSSALSGGSYREHQLPLTAHCKPYTFQNTGCSSWVSSQFCRSRQGPREMPMVYLLKKVHHGAICTSQLKKWKTTLPGQQIKLPGTCLWSAFSWWPWRGKSQSKGSREAMEAASGNSEGQVKRLECGAPPFLNFLSQWWFYKHNLPTAPQLLHL